MFKQFRNKKKIIDFFKKYHYKTKKILIKSKENNWVVYINYQGVIYHIVNKKNKCEDLNALVIAIEKGKERLRREKEKVFNQLIKDMNLQVDEEIMEIIKSL